MKNDYYQGGDPFGKKRKKKEFDYNVLIAVLILILIPEIIVILPGGNMNTTDLLSLVLPPIPFLIAGLAIYYRRKKMTDQELKEEIQKIKAIPDNNFSNRTTLPGQFGNGPFGTDPTDSV
jgi:hypothetical protein